MEAHSCEISRLRGRVTPLAHVIALVEWELGALLAHRPPSVAGAQAVLVGSNKTSGTVSPQLHQWHGWSESGNDIATPPLHEDMGRPHDHDDHGMAAGPNSILEALVAARAENAALRRCLWSRDVKAHCRSGGEGDTSELSPRSRLVPQQLGTPVGGAGGLFPALEDALQRCRPGLCSTLQELTPSLHPEAASLAQSVIQSLDYLRQLTRMGIGEFRDRKLFIGSALSSPGHLSSTACRLRPVSPQEVAWPLSSQLSLSASEPGPSMRVPSTFGGLSGRADGISGHGGTNEFDLWGLPSSYL